MSKGRSPLEEHSARVVENLGKALKEEETKKFRHMFIEGWIACAMAANSVGDIRQRARDAWVDYINKHK